VTRLVIASSNPHKLEEIRALLPGVPLVSLAELPRIEEPEETGDTFEENAALKALYYDRHLQPHVERQGLAPAFVVAEDSGFVVDALGGEPGVRSARFVGPDATYPERFAEIYRRLAAAPDAPRRARFVCALAVAGNGTVAFGTTAAVEGEVSPEPRGGAGFGYDPIFFYPPYGRTLAEVTQQEKLAVAHRGKAFRALAQWLASQNS
jgi:XTP/dITP diphosphohydrolase